MGSLKRKGEKDQKSKQNFYFFTASENIEKKKNLSDPQRFLRLRGRKETNRF
jgi:hypothetical protein